MGHGGGGGGGGHGGGSGGVNTGQKRGRFAMMQMLGAMRRQGMMGPPQFGLAVGDFFNPGQKIMGIAIPFTTVTGTVGAASAIVLAENVDRRYLLIQNIHATQDFHIGFDEAATTAMLKIEPSGWYEPIMVPTSQIRLIGTGVGTNFVIIHG